MSASVYLFTDTGNLVTLDCNVTNTLQGSAPHPFQLSYFSFDHLNPHLN